jgi:stress response protein YsnF
VRNEELKKTIAVVEERVKVDKSVETTARIRVKKTVEEVEEPIAATLHSEDYHVERIAKNEFIEKAPPPVKNENDRIIVSVVEERLVVEKKLFLVEEIHLIKTNHTSEFHDKVILKKEAIDVTRESNLDNKNNT